MCAGILGAYEDQDRALAMAGVPPLADAEQWHEALERARTLLSHPALS
jgi:hypothetical protein